MKIHALGRRGFAPGGLGTGKCGNTDVPSLLSAKQKSLKVFPRVKSEALVHFPPRGASMVMLGLCMSKLLSGPAAYSLYTMLARTSMERVMVV